MFININILLAVIICIIILYIFYNIFICENFAIQKRESDEVWGVNAANQILKAKLPCLDRNNNIKCDWKLVGDNLKQVSQSDGKVWAIDNDNNIKYCINTKQTPCSSEEDWKTIPVSLKQISVGKDAVWGVNDENIKYCINTVNYPCNDNKWVNINSNLPNKLTNVSIK